MIFIKISFLLIRFAIVCSTTSITSHCKALSCFRNVVGILSTETMRKMDLKSHKRKKNCSECYVTNTFSLFVAISFFPIGCGLPSFIITLILFFYIVHAKINSVNESDLILYFLGQNCNDA